MSFSLSTITDGLSGASDLLSGGSVRLGSFAFQSFEVPEKITSGGAHANSMHKMPGGARVLDLTGPDDAPVTWSGLFLGSNAKQRAQRLNQIRLAGQAVDLTWGVSRFRVVLTECTFDEGFHQIGYRLSCDIVPLPDAVDASAKESMLDQIGDAIGVTGLTAQVGAATDALSIAQDSLQRISDVLPAVPGLSMVLSGLNTATSLGQVAVTGGGGALSGITSLASAGSLSGAISASGLLAGGIAVASLAGAGVRTIQAL